MQKKIVNNRKKFLNREIGLIQFNSRILDNINSSHFPLLEKLNFLCIVCRNIDELFEVRFARLMQQSKENPKQKLPDGLDINEALSLIRIAVRDLYNNIYNIYNNYLIPELNKVDCRILPAHLWSYDIKKWSYEYFLKKIKPVITIFNQEVAQLIPKIPNKSLFFAIDIENNPNQTIDFVEFPNILPKIIKIPFVNNTFILIQDIIKENIGELFELKKINGCYPCKVTRNAVINQKLNISDLANEIVKELYNRKFAMCTRMELDISVNKPTKKFLNRLLHQFNLTRDDLYLANGPVNLSKFTELIDLVDNPKLKFTKFIPGLPESLINEKNIFTAISKSDILIHTPYQSFDPVIWLTTMAYQDSQVIAIKMTVYRTNVDSQLVQNLIKAAKCGKQVTASIELFARFDEETNLEVARALETAGASVVYGVMGYKVHAKMLLIVRKEGGKIQEYAHLGTGNYHQNTTKTYTDFGLLTINRDIVADVNNIFTQITGIGKVGVLNTLYQAPFTFHDLIISKIDTEIDNAKNGNKAIIKAKMNSLLEKQIIEKLYLASKNGVKIDLIVRGACALIPKLKGISDNIRVVSIVGRFLEHHRVFYFHNSGRGDVYISSGDWMPRNFFKRFETCIPILDNKIKKRVIEEGIDVYLKDNQDSWVLQNNGKYKKNTPKKNKKKFQAQAYLLKKLKYLER